MKIGLSMLLKNINGGGDMIIAEIISENGIEYLYTYSSLGWEIERDGIRYGDAIDPVDSGRTYIEVEPEIENGDEEITVEEFMSLIEGAL